MVRVSAWVAVAAAILVLAVLGFMRLEPWEAADLSAKESAERACTVMTQNHYDAVGITPTSEGSLRTEERYAGGDTHVVNTWLDHQGNIDGKMEQIFKDGVLYTRVTGEAGPTEYGAWDVYSPGIAIDRALPCYPSGEGTSGGFSALAQGNVHIYYTQTGADGEVVKTEFWASSEGVPTHGRRTVTLPPGADTTGVSDGSSTVVTEITFSGFGETNVITAPAPASTPTVTPPPMPTPAAP